MGNTLHPAEGSEETWALRHQLIWKQSRGKELRSDWKSRLRVVFQIIPSPSWTAGQPFCSHTGDRIFVLWGRHAWRCSLKGHVGGGGRGRGGSE